MKHNNSNYDPDDPDDDLRSLLSDHSNNNNNKKKLTVPGSPSKHASGKSSRHESSDEVSLSSLLGEQMEHPHHPGGVTKGSTSNSSSSGGGQPSSQQAKQGHITHLASSSWDENNSPNNNVTMMSSPPHNHHHHPMTRRKKLLTALGTIILCMGLVGPSGLLWNLFDEEATNNNASESSLLRSTFKDVGIHSPSSVVGLGGVGDKHHHLPNGEVNNIDGNVWLRSNSKKKKNAFKSRAQKKNVHNSRRGGDDADNSPIHSNIKEAIANIDKVFLDEHPTYRNSIDKKQQKEAARWQRKKEHQREENQKKIGNFLGGLPNDKNGNHQSSESRGGNTNNKDDALDEDDDEFVIQDADASNLPVIHVDDNDLPENADALDTFTNSLPASEALECRASVIAFVINATDVKDECDGLRKAFDKTCSVQHSPTSGAGAGEGKGATTGGNAYAQRRRRLQERGKPRVSNLISDAVQRELSNVRSN
eukprot:scaffold7656_cov76-Skeletonema_marinoi.AAC.1